MNADVLGARATLLLALGLTALLAYRRRLTVASEARAIFYAGGSPILLGFFRATIFGYVAIGQSGAAAAVYADFPRDLMFPPFGVAWIADLIPVDAGTIKAGALVLRVSATCAAIGLATRISSITATLAALYVLGVPQLFGKVNHYHHLIWFMALLAASPSGDALSVDSVLRRLSGRAPLLPPSSAAHGAPLRVAALLLGIAYFFPGFHKLWSAGFAWVVGDTLERILYAKWFELGGWTPGFRIDHHHGLLTLAALGTVAFELSFLPLAFFARTRRLVIPTGLLFHTATGYFMKISFFSLQVCYVCLLEDHSHDEHERTTPPSASFVSIAAVLLAANLAAGATRTVHAWPFACYPTFAGTPAILRPVLKMEGPQTTGAPWSISIGAGTPPLGFAPERLGALLDRILAERDEPVRTRRLGALAAVLKRRGVIPLEVMEITITRKWHATHPELQEHDVPLPPRVLARIAF